MPTVPNYQRQTQTEAAAPQVAKIQYSPDNFGAGLAQVADRATNIFAQEKAKYDDSQLQDSVLKLNAGMQSIQTEQNQLQGQNAMGSAPAAIQKYHDLAGEIGITVPENRRRDWQRQVEGGALQLNGVTERHEFNQIQQYRQGQQQAIIANGVTSAEGLYADPVAYKLNGARTRESIQTYGQSQGWSSEEIRAKQDDFTQKSALAAANALNGADYTAMLIQNGEPSDVAGSMRVPSTSSQSTDSSAPRGIRNNNPGNIEFNANNEWQGRREAMAGLPHSKLLSTVSELWVKTCCHISVRVMKLQSRLSVAGHHQARMAKKTTQTRISKRSVLILVCS